MSNIDFLIHSMQSSSVYECYDQRIIPYIKQLHIPENAKCQLLKIIANDDYNDYEEICNICKMYGVEI